MLIFSIMVKLAEHKSVLIGKIENEVKPNKRTKLI